MSLGSPRSRLVGARTELELVGKRGSRAGAEGGAAADEASAAANEAIRPAQKLPA